MMRNLRYVMRLWLKKTWCQQVLQTRDLSVADAVNALRPFYFAVHPDFFGQHPREREINENSLKRLNGYLESLQKPNIRNPKPTQLTFYVRQTDESGFGRHLGSSGFRTVSFTLRTRDLQDTILNILNSCSLPTEHVQNFKAGVDSPQLQGTQSIFYRPIKWDKTYYSFTGFRDPEEELEEARKVEPTLNTWLEQNEATATKKLKDSLPLREELELLKSKLCDQLHLNDIRWQRSWGISHRCSQLHSLSRLSQQSPEILKNVKGRIIIFTDQSGLSASGHVMLGTTDVHHQWAKVFEKLPSYYGLQRQMLSLEDRTSHLLGGMQIVFIEELQPLFSIEEYYSILSTFYNRICNNRLSFHPRSLRGLEMVLEKLRKLAKSIPHANKT
ncbi:T-cell activation inhibitor, mitochondrial isoform X2 [Protopterus annectens]|uniref:T-cell activation inhibitor, mitochondrial isoform X2 n=1 Tax=Protopterus annectens TaxID=7888 RepID=UPI001CFA46A2|nr:T-cell activation inhibitor, mitochondrial isoform X2 [Protopterus annectens]